MTRIKFLFFFLITTLYIASASVTMADDDFFYSDDFSDLINDTQVVMDDHDMAMEMEEEEFLASEEVARIQQEHKDSCLTPFQAVEFLTTPPLCAQVVLQEDLYRHTNPINTRSLLDLPGFYHHYYCCPKTNNFWMQLFYNQTRKAYYTKESSQIRSYVFLDNPNLIQIIDDQVEHLDIPLILSIFSNTRLEERRTGFMFGGQHIWDRWFIRAYAPLYYLERNIFLTDEEQEMLERAGVPALDNKMDFARQHVISDRVGWGDGRAELGYTVLDTDHVLMRLGGQFTLPIAQTFAKGLYGSHFPKELAPPDFSLLEFLNLLLDTPKQDIPKGIQEGTDFLIGAIDHLSAMVLETGLGNNGHFGLGVFADHQLFVSPCISFRTKASLEYLVPRTEKRFYIMKKTPQEFLDRDYTDPEQGTANLAFLNEQLIETLYPTMFKTRIFPGYNFVWNTSVTYHGKKVDVQFGYDIWWQDKEKLGRIKATEEVVRTLRTDIAVKPGAYQSKLFGDLVFKKEGSKRFWCIGLHLDATIISSGVGKDVTGAFYFNATI